MTVAASSEFLLLVFPLVFGNLIIYPAPNGAPTSNKFQIFVSQNGHRQQSHVYMTSSQHRTQDASHVKGGRTMSWTSFAFTGTRVTVEVHTPKDFHSCIVRPKSYGFNCHRTGNKVAQFDVTSNTKMMSVEFDYDYGSSNGGPDITDKLLVFADPPETQTPNKHDSSVLYYDVGVHDLSGQKALDAHIKEVYLAPGAWVKGGFKSTGNHAVKIHGRGVMDTSAYRWHDKRFSWALINLDNGDHHTVEGITLSDPCYFFVRALSDHNTVRNVKMVGAWIYNNDGVSTGSDGVVEDCFIHANDDAIKLYKDGITVQRCVVWQAQNGAVFQTGWWDARHMKHVKVSDVDVIHTDWCTFKGSGNCHTSGNNAVLDQGGNTQDIAMSDIEFKNIRVEGSCPRLIYWRMHDGAHGTASDIRFINWQVESQPTQDSMHNEIAGTGNSGHVTNWQFVNFHIGGQCVNNPAHFDFQIDAHSTSGFHFQCGGNPVG
ncbi:dextranase-like [Littorina saxatilis]|uniref:Endo-polygalacturonase n=1 Tax=Littorina saxatilis TaxID=31220 RepID=A0AAN9BBK3_9CAEN